MNNKSKGLVTLFTIFFTSIFLVLIISQNNNFEDTSIFTNIQLLNTKKQSNILNLENIINIQLNNTIEDPYLQNIIVNNKLIEYFNNNDYWIITNTTNNKEEKITLTKLNLLSKTIIFKPHKNILVKQYNITRGLNKDELLVLKIRKNNYFSIYKLPEGFKVEVIVNKV